MPKGYRHLTYEERCQIHALRKSGLSDAAIARQLGRDRTTVWREVRRNGGLRGYCQVQFKTDPGIAFNFDPP
ncbi:MAG: helix-turn-helix domain-containing protein, partial [Boseongicola sp. SB0662_bin_57]|nr:helix-turn-helix domain-containing protein [Boseongicola sp. SB0662_bin_57]